MVSILNEAILLLEKNHVSYISSFLSVNTTLLALVLAAVSIIPTFIQITKESSTSYMSTHAHSEMLANSLKRLGATMLLFGLSAILCIFSFIIVNICVVAAIFILTFLGVSIVTIESFRVSRSISKSLT